MKYQKPIFEKEKKLNFPMEIIAKFNNGSQTCVQCSRCHGCT